MNNHSGTMSIHPCAIAVEKNRFCCVDAILNIIVMFDLSDGSIINIVTIPKCIDLDDDSRRIVRIYKDKIVFIPNNETTIYVWDSGKWNTYELYKKKKKGFYLFSQAKIIDDVLYVFPYTEKITVKLDFNRKQVELSDRLLLNIRNCYKTQITSINAPSFVDGYTIVGGISLNNLIYHFNLINQEFSFAYLKKKDCAIPTIAAIGNSLLVWNKTKGDLYRVNKSTKEIEKELNVGKVRAKIVDLNSNYVLLDMLDTKEFWIINEELDVIYKYEEELDDNKYYKGENIIEYGFDKGFYYISEDGSLFEIDMYGMVKKSNLLYKVRISLDDEKVGFGKSIMKEEISFDLRDYIDTFSWVCKK